MLKNITYKYKICIKIEQWHWHSLFSVNRIENGREIQPKIFMKQMMQFQFDLFIRLMHSAISFEKHKP